MRYSADELLTSTCMVTYDRIATPPPAACLLTLPHAAEWQAVVSNKVIQTRVFIFHHKSHQRKLGYPDGKCAGFIPPRVEAWKTEWHLKLNKTCEHLKKKTLQCCSKKHWHGNLYFKWVKGRKLKAWAYSGMKNTTYHYSLQLWSCILHCHLVPRAPQSW